MFEENNETVEKLFSQKQKEYLDIFLNNMTSLEKLIKDRMYIDCKFSISIREQYINFETNDLLEQFGNGGKSLFKNIHIEGHCEILDFRGLVPIFLNFKYKHIHGGSNGYKINDSGNIYFYIYRKEWIWDLQYR